MPDGAGASGSPGRRGCSGRPAATSRARSWTPRNGPPRPASRCGSSATSGGPRPMPRTSPRPSASCSPTTPSPVATTSSTAVSPRAPTGPPTSLTRLQVATPVVAVPAATWTRASVPPRWGVLAPTPLPSGEPIRPWTAGDGRLRTRAAPRRGPLMPEPVDRPRLPGVRYGRIARFARSRAVRSASCGGPAPTPDADRFVQANLSTSATGVLRGLHLHRRQLDRWVVASGRGFVALVDVRPMLRADAPAAAPLVETRELAGRRLGGHPGRGRPRLPGPRAAGAHLRRDQRVRQQRRARLRLGRSAGGRPLAGRRDARWAADPVGPRPSQPVAGGPRGALRA